MPDTATESALLRSVRVLHVVLVLHAVTLLVAATLVGWHAEVCEAGAATCQRSWPRAAAWWTGGVVSALVPLTLGRFLRVAAQRLEQLTS